MYDVMQTKACFFYTNPKAQDGVWHKMTCMSHSLEHEKGLFSKMGYVVVDTVEQTRSHPTMGTRENPYFVKSTR